MVPTLTSEISRRAPYPWFLWITFFANRIASITRTFDRSSIPCFCWFAATAVPLSCSSDRSKESEWKFHFYKKSQLLEGWWQNHNFSHFIPCWRSMEALWYHLQLGIHPMNQGPETTGAIVKRLSCSILGSLSINRNKYNVTLSIDFSNNNFDVFML